MERTPHSTFLLCLPACTKFKLFLASNADVDTNLSVFLYQVLQSFTHAYFHSNRMAANLTALLGHIDLYLKEMCLNKAYDVTICLNQYFATHAYLVIFAVFILFTIIS